MFTLLFFLEFNLLLDDSHSIFQPYGYTLYAYNFMTSETKYGYIQLGVEVTILDYFFIGGSMKTFVGYPYQVVFFYLLGLDSVFKIGFKYEGWELGFRHECDHPIYPYFQKEGHQDYMQLTEFTNSEIYLRVEGKVRY